MPYVPLSPSTVLTNGYPFSNLEWNNGYSPRFGVTYIDRANGFKRIPKDSSKTVAAIWDHAVQK